MKIVKGRHDDDINDNNDTNTTTRNSSNSSPRIFRILIILALLAIISEIFVPTSSVTSTNISDASFATPTTTTQQHHKSSQSNQNANNHANTNNPNANNIRNKRTVQIEKCTPSELALILHQLPNDDCLTYKKQPWRQNCSLTYATKCPGMFVFVFCLFVCLAWYFVLFCEGYPMIKVFRADFGVWYYTCSAVLKTVICFCMLLWCVI